MRAQCRRLANDAQITRHSSELAADRMTANQSSASRSNRRAKAVKFVRRWHLVLWTERLLILVAWLNLMLVAFHMTYVPLRSWYLRAALLVRDWGTELPLLGQVVGPPGEVRLFYDPIVGIEPERQTQAYLKVVDQLVTVLERGGVDSPQVSPLLADLRDRSQEMINQNPFTLSDRTGSLEIIKNRMRDRLGLESSKRAFDTFWSVDYLRSRTWTRELRFFDREIRFQLQSNYFRSIGEDGRPADYFGILDTPFVILFAVEFVVRTLWIRRRYSALSWQAAAFSHWWDLLFISPFFRWLRIIPVVIRSNKAQFPNLEPIRALISRGILAGIASELTEVVVLEFIYGLQSSVKSGSLSQQILDVANNPYVEVNDVNEIQAIFDRVLQLSLYRVLPEIQEDLARLLAYQMESVLARTPTYQALRALPGFSNFSNQLAGQIAANLSAIATNVPQKAYKTFAVPDPEAEKLLEKLVEDASAAFRQGLAEPKTQQELQELIFDLLEELKLSYIKRSRDRADSLQILQETEQLRLKAGKPKL